MRVLPLAEAKARLSQLVAELESADDEITITKNGRAAAVLVSHEEFERWRETLEILSDPQLRTEIRKGIRELRRGSAKTFAARDLDRLFASRQRSG
jgi:prevent-host-death family protein